MKLKALIIEEEKSAARELHGLLEKNCSQVKVTGVYTSVSEAASFIGKETMDVLFLNAEMPGSISPGMRELVGSTQLYTVFMATHQDYAIKAIKQDADDFLQKPIDAGELVISMNKAQEHFDKPKSAAFVKSSPTLPVNTQAGIFLLNKEDIIYIKADGRYSELYYRDEQRYSVCKNIGLYEGELRNDFFFRVHKSYLVNCRHIIKINSRNGSFVELKNHKEIELSKRKKSEFLRFLK